MLCDREVCLQMSGRRLLGLNEGFNSAFLSVVRYLQFVKVLVHVSI